MTQRSRSQLVNALTFARVPLILAWAALAVWQEFACASDRCGSFALACAACLMMLLSGLTDAWDGALARKWGVVSTLGKMADPLMDKIFYLVAFPVLVWQAAQQGESAVHAFVLLVFTVVYLMRDTWVTFMRSVGALYGADVAAMWLGKVRTALSFPGAGWVYMYLCFHRLAPESWNCPWLCSCYFVEATLVILTLVSAWTYTRAYLPYLRRALAEK